MKIMNFGMLPIDLSELSHFLYHFVSDISFCTEYFNQKTKF